MGAALHLVRTSPAWLTAVMTLVGGLPHFDCRCPDGRIKPFCLPVTANRTGCCCGGACCGGQGSAHETAGPKRPAARSCCEQEPTETKIRLAAGGHGQAKARGCVRTVSPADAAVAVQKAPIAKPVFTSAALSPCPNHCGLSLTMPVGRCGHEPLHGVGPPPDLITLLQHLLI